MAPNRKFRTYGRGNNSSISCMQAFDILFAKNLTQRKIEQRAFKGKNKIKFDIKELPAKIKTVLSDDSSLQVNMNDTFNNLLKKPCTNLRPNNVSVKIIKDNSSYSVIKDLNLSKVSLMPRKLRSNSNKSLATNTTNSWFNDPTPSGEGITNILEIEKIGSSWKNINKSKKLSEPDRKSPILLRSHSQMIAQTNNPSRNISKYSFEITNLSKQSIIHSSTNAIFNPIFTNSLIHSTPVVSNKKKCLMGQAVSPIKSQDAMKNCIVESLEEIKSWNLSLPQIEPQNLKKTENSQTEPLQTSSYNLEDFEIFEQFKSESIKVENDFRTKSISLDDFEIFHKEFIESQLRNEEKAIKGISVKDFEAFCESYQKKISFNGSSFFENRQKSINFVTHRKHKFSLVPKLTRHSRLSTKFNLKDLVVVLDNNLMNYSSLSYDNSLINSINKRQLTVKLKRISLDKLKLAVNQPQSFFKAERKHSINKYKACRKFSSNWNMENSRFRPNETLDISIKNALSYLNDRAGVKSIIAKSISDNLSENDEARRRTDISRFGKENYDKSEKENELSCIKYPGAEKMKSLPVSSPNFRGSRRALLRFSGRKSDTSLYYLRTSRLENSQEIVDQQPLTPSPLCKSVNKPKQNTEKQYVAKILTISTSDSSNEFQNEDTYASPVTRNRTYNSYFDYSNKEVTPHLRRQTEANFNKSNAEISSITRDLRGSVLFKRNTSQSYDVSSPLPTNTSKSFTRNSTTTSICLRSNTKQSPANNECYQSETDTKSLNSSGVSNNSERLDQIQDCIFKSPLMINCRRKPPNLKAGKSWRRSLLQHKKDISNDLTRNSYYGVARKQDENLRLSAQILPLEETNRLRRKTTLQTYVYSDMVMDESVNDTTQTLRKSSLGEPKSLITARDLVLEYCGQADTVPFEKMYPKSLLKNCKKIGEGVYGEVFLYTQTDGSSTVMKVIPIEGDKLINGERQKKFHEILSEVAIVSQLSNLRNNFHNKTSAFCEVQRISCVKGKYPKVLLDYWREYDEVKGSENDPPDVFESDQLYIVLDLANAGQDLEAFVFNNALQAIAMFKQIAYALAVGEEHVQFEHRDLHWGNILLRAVDKRKKVIFKHKGKVKECLSQGVEATIIDFTLSRIAHEGVVIFNDLGQDPDLFVAEGDYQFDIYRLMKERNNNDWRKFTPYTNILWLHYVLKKSITALRYKNTKTKIHRNSIDSLKKYEQDILNFNSVSEFVEEYL